MAWILNDSWLLASRRPTSLAMTADAAPLNVFGVFVIFCDGIPLAVSCSLTRHPLQYDLKNSSLPRWRLSRTCWLMSTCYSFNPLVTILDTHNARTFQYPRSPTAACSISREISLGPVTNQLFTSAQNFITTNNRTTCFVWSLSHLQVLNMLQVSGSCAHICSLKLAAY